MRADGSWRSIVEWTTALPSMKRIRARFEWTGHLRERAICTVISCPGREVGGCTSVIADPTCPTD
jgi:hypothetical protein